MLPLRARVNLGAMAIKGYSTFSKAPALLEPHHQIVLCHIQDTRCGWWDLSPLHRNSRCILQLQPNGPSGSPTPLQKCSHCILQPQPIGPRKIFFTFLMYFIFILFSNLCLLCLYVYQLILHFFRFYVCIDLILSFECRAFAFNRDFFYIHLKKYKKGQNKT